MILGLMMTLMMKKAMKMMTNRKTVKQNIYFLNRIIRSFELMNTICCYFLKLFFYTRALSLLCNQSTG